MTCQHWPEGKPRPGTIRVRFSEILATVAARHGVSPSELVGPSSKRRYAWPRQEVMAIAYRETPLSYPEIGRRLGGRDHSTVIHGVRKHEKRMAEAQA